MMNHLKHITLHFQTGSQLQPCVCFEPVNSFCLVIWTHAHVSLPSVGGLFLSSVCASSAVPLAKYFPTLWDMFYGYFSVVYSTGKRRKGDSYPAMMMSTFCLWKQIFICILFIVNLFCSKHNTLVLSLDRSTVAVVAACQWNLYL